MILKGHDSLHLKAIDCNLDQKKKKKNPKDIIGTIQIIYEMNNLLNATLVSWL